VPDRTCCLLSSLLGNRTMSLRLLEAVRTVAAGPVDEVWFGEDAYRHHPAPAWARRSDELEAEAVASRLLRGERLPDAALYVANTVVLAQVARARRPHARWAVATDATLALTDRMRARAYGAPSFARRAFRRVQGARFGRLAREIDVWLPMSEACRDSLVEDYGVARERCLVTSAPQASVDVGLPKRDASSGPWRLLFVGNDFARKGGPELCAALAQLPDAHLTIVSRDPLAAVQAAALGPARATLHAGISSPAALAPVYRAAHLLVHPTRIDHYSHVICEGLARGLPFAVTEGTPPAELIARSGAGVGIPWPPTPDGIAGAIRDVLDSPVRHFGLCARALAYAQRELRMEVFESRLAAALDGAGNPDVADAATARLSGAGSAPSPRDRTAPSP
jgi:glycosyltransferase involved in cell wall biosynthesis